MTKNNKDGQGKDKCVLRTKEDFTFLSSLKIKSYSFYIIKRERKQRRRGLQREQQKHFFVHFFAVTAQLGRETS